MKLFVVVLAAGLLIPHVWAQDAPENVLFRWGFGALTGPKKNFVPITRDTSLSSGDEIKMVVELRKECFIYLVYHSSKGELTLLFPESFRQFAGDYAVARNYYIPKGRSWFQLDKTTGKETFYLLASADRLIDLEALIGEYESAPSGQKPEAAKKVLSEIRELKRRFRTFTTLAERPVTIGGNIRGVEEAGGTKRPDVASVATEISASNFYTKTFTIDHQ